MLLKKSTRFHRLATAVAAIALGVCLLTGSLGTASAGRSWRSGGPQVGDIVTFGSYEQNNDQSCTEPIEWIVLDRDGDNALLLSRYCLDNVPFHDQQVETKWADSYLRQWLNDTFLYAAFSRSEREDIVSTSITTSCNPVHGTSGGRDTTDQVFLLSIDEVESYFDSDTDRRVEATAYAKRQGAQVYNTGAWWRLRSPGKFDYSVASVYASGQIAYDGDAVSDYGCAIRPAIWVEY